jgi:hypothetical protein
MALYEGLRKVIDDSELTSEEARAFETGLNMLTHEEQVEFTHILRTDPEMIYPLYINYKAKLRAARGTEEDWIRAVETEIVQLEDYLAKKRVGDEIQ